MKTILLAILLVVGFASQAEACKRCGRSAAHCIHQTHIVQKVVAVPIVQNQYISYFVGQPIRVESIIQKTIQSDPEYQAFQQYKQFVRQQHAQPAPQQPDGNVPADPEPINPAVSVLSTKCASCHSGDAPKGQILLDGTAPLSDAIRVKASKAVIEGRMPPKERPQLTDQEYSDVLREIITTLNQE